MTKERGKGRAYVLQIVINVDHATAVWLASNLSVRDVTAIKNIK